MESFWNEYNEAKNIYGILYEDYQCLNSLHSITVLENDNYSESYIECKKMFARSPETATAETILRIVNDYKVKINEQEVENSIAILKKDIERLDNMVFFFFLMYVRENIPIYWVFDSYTMDQYGLLCDRYKKIEAQQKIYYESLGFDNLRNETLRVLRGSKIISF